jgi:hypothetical protein
MHESRLGVLSAHITDKNQRRAFPVDHHGVHVLIDTVDASTTEGSAFRESLLDRPLPARKASVQSALTVFKFPTYGTVVDRPTVRQAERIATEASKEQNADMQARSALYETDQIV